MFAVMSAKVSDSERAAIAAYKGPIARCQDGEARHVLHLDGYSIFPAKAAEKDEKIGLIDSDYEYLPGFSAGYKQRNQKIRDLIDAGISRLSVAERFGLSPRTIPGILRVA